MIEIDKGHWKFEGNIPEGSIGFVYLITDKDGKKYIGKKLLENKKKRKPLKGRVNGRRYMVESDWKIYCGSSPQLHEYIEKNGKEGMEFIILKFCESKLMLAYEEAREIIERKALFSKEYWNEVLNLRIRYHANKKIDNVSHCKIN